MTELKFGNPPPIEDCVDIGTVPDGVAPFKLENTGRFAGLDILTREGVAGSVIPPVRRAWLVVAYYRPRVRSGDIPVPYVVRVPGLGTLTYNLGAYGDEWEVH